jgi:LysM repeat protein
VNQYEQSSGCGKLFNILVGLGCVGACGIALCAGLFFAFMLTDLDSEEANRSPVVPTQRAVTDTATQTPIVNATTTGAALIEAQLTRTPRPTATPETISPTATPEPTIHIVESGDTLGAIAAQYGVTVEAIVEANDIEDPNTLRVGQELIIPVNGLTPSVGTGESSLGSSTADELAYGEWVVEITEQLVEASTLLGDLFSELGEDQSVYFDSEWQFQVGFGLGVLQGVADSIAEQQAPPRFANFHESFQAVGVDIANAVTAYQEGLDTLDADRFAEGNDYISSAAEKMRTLPLDELGIEP